MRAWLADRLALAVYIGKFLGRNKAVRSGLITVVSLLFLIWIILGPNALALVLSMAFRLMFAMGFMVIQFGALFWFLARSKSITILPGDKKVKTLDDYKGQPVLVSSMRSWVKILQGAEGFYRMGGKPPTGLLLYGEPGTGKTYLAACVAGNAGVGFHSLDGSSFQAMFIGIPVLKMLAFFNKVRSLALEYGSCIGYIDEIDAVGGSRGGGMQAAGGQAMGSAGFFGGMGALTTMLTQMSGLHEERGMTTARNIARRWLGLKPLQEGYVLIIGGTNRPDVLDKALVRPGRLGKKIAVDPPDAPGRKDIFSFYLDKVSHTDIDLDALVSATHGITPAAIEAAVTEDAIRLAWSAGRETIAQDDIAKALIEQSMGLPNPIGDLPIEQQKQVAYHEAGHAVALYHLRKDQKIAFVSCIRRGATLGFMAPVFKESTYAMPLSMLVADIRMSLAGDVASEIMLGERWTGAASDLEHVRQRVQYLAWHGVFGGMMLEPGKPTPDMAKEIDRFISEQWDATRKLLIEHRRQLEALGATLLEKSELSGDEATRIIEGASK